MKDKALQYVCSQCGHVEAKWLGRCPECGNWNTFEEEAVPVATNDTRKSVIIDSSGKVQALNEVVVEPGYRFSTGISELDRVLGGSLMRGSSILLGGEPGIGKSTLMLQMIAKCAQERSVLYVSGEESAGQVKLRAERLSLNLKGISIICDTRIEILETLLGQLKPQIVVIDSLQTLVCSDIPSPAGSINQIRACSTALVGVSKQLGISLFLVGHITKEGILAGPKVIEHLVDTVLSFEESGSGVRMIRALKNRFGSVDEIGIFLMTEKGLEVVKEPSLFFMGQREKKTLPPGIAYTAIVEGSRTFLVEIQALTIPAKSGFSRVYSDRIDAPRVLRVSAILERHTSLALNDQDIYVNVAGGIKLSEVSIELPLALALWSAYKNVSLPSQLVSFGELSLAGEVRPVGFSDKRVKASLEMGFDRLLVAKGTKLGKLINASAVSNIKEALSLLN
ncbi:MAG: DNA repair protein RadA [Sphaerochaetaceae bacterium]